ncbi:MAG: CvpA family protein [Campylobacterales bacterium]|nr:CvpA family protein [Campylobacterales bacterium]
MEISYFDLIVGSIILLLGLKGIINGFFKEVFGLVGIIGGIFIASRIGDSVGEYLNTLIFNFSSPAAVSFLGFLTTLAIFWLLMVFVGFLFKKLSAMSGLGPVDKLLGFVFGASKFFLIAAVIAHAAYNIKALRTTIDNSLQGSILLPVLVETGSVIMKIDPVEMSEDLNATIEKSSDVIEEKTQELVEESAKEQIEEIKNELKEK